MPRKVVIKKKQWINISDFIKVGESVKIDILRQISDEYQLSFDVLSAHYLRKKK